jgi:hypothetical protein
VCALVVSGFSFQKILELEEPDFTVFNVDQPSAKYTLISHDKCVGTLSSTLIKDRTSTWTTAGVLRASIGGKSFDATINIEGTFNPLGQLQTSSLKLTAMSATITATTKGVMPIVAALSVTMAGGTMSREISLPGPVTLEGDNKHARLRYPQATGFSKNYTNLISNQLISSIDLRAVIDNKQRRCQSESEQGRLDLTLLSNSMASSLQPLDSMLGGINVPQ